MSEKNTEKKVRIGNNVFSLEIVDRNPLEKEMNRSVIEVKARSSKNRAVITGADFKREIQWLLGKEGDNIPIVGKKGKIVLIISKISFDSATIEFDNSSEACGYEPISFHGSRDDCSGIIDNIAEMMDAVLQILDPKQHLLILNAYSLGFSALVPQNLLEPFATKHKSNLSIGELYLDAKSGIKLPLGVWGRLEKK